MDEGWTGWSGQFVVAKTNHGRQVLPRSYYGVCPAVVAIFGMMCAVGGVGTRQAGQRAFVDGGAVVQWCVKWCR
jgi:hypothetical protein